MFKINSQKGSALVEAIVALSTILIMVAAISVVVTLSVANSTFVRNQNSANKYAQDSMEFLRGMKENNYDTFTQYRGDNGNNYCMDANSQLILDCYDQVIPEIGFKRDVVFRVGCGTEGPIYDDDEGNNPQDVDTEVTVTVKWSSGRCPQSNTFCHKAEIVSCFSPPTDAVL